ncbi:uncharacterized protein METZ01_LOCUS284658 [marine metagenome]|uniref:Uncharacterized protein n=1 Tax=marine metagenome TaxID=408172 RepID=A0A382L4F9_9ZZZZ
MSQDWPTFIVKTTECVLQIGLVGDVVSVEDVARKMTGDFHRTTLADTGGCAGY